MNEDFKTLLLNMADIDDLKKTVNTELESGTNPLSIIKTLNEVLDEVGERYEQGDLFLSDLMMIGYLASEVTNILKPHMVGDEFIETLLETTRSTYRRQGNSTSQ